MERRPVECDGNHGLCYADHRRNSSHVDGSGSRTKRGYAGSFGHGASPCPDDGASFCNEYGPGNRHGDGRLCCAEQRIGGSFEGGPNYGADDGASGGADDGAGWRVDKLAAQHAYD